MYRLAGFTKHILRIVVLVAFCSPVQAYDLYLYNNVGAGYSPSNNLLVRSVVAQPGAARAPHPQMSVGDQQLLVRGAMIKVVIADSLIKKIFKNGRLTIEVARPVAGPSSIFSFEDEEESDDEFDDPTQGPQPTWTSIDLTEAFRVEKTHALPGLLIISRDETLLHEEVVAVYDYEFYTVRSFVQTPVAETIAAYIASWHKHSTHQITALGRIDVEDDGFREQWSRLRNGKDRDALLQLSQKIIVAKHAILSTLMVPEKPRIDFFNLVSQRWHKARSRFQSMPANLKNDLMIAAERRLFRQHNKLLFAIPTKMVALEEGELIKKSNWLSLAKHAIDRRFERFFEAERSRPLTGDPRDEFERLAALLMEFGDHFRNLRDGRYQTLVQRLSISAPLFLIEDVPGEFGTFLAMVRERRSSDVTELILSVMKQGEDILDEMDLFAEGDEAKQRIDEIREKLKKSLLTIQIQQVLQHKGDIPNVLHPAE